MATPTPPPAPASPAGATLRGVGLRRPMAPLVAVALAVACGSIVDRVGGPSGVWWAGATCLGLLAWLLVARCRNTTLAAGVLLLTLAAAGGLYHHWRWAIVGGDDIALLLDAARQPIVLEGTAEGRARPQPVRPFDPLDSLGREPRSHLHLTVTAIRLGSTWRPASGRVRVAVDGVVVQPRTGDHLRVFGQWQGLEEPLNPGEPDTAAWARAEGFSGRVSCQSVDAIEVRASPRRLTLFSLLDDARWACLEQITRHLSGPNQGIGQALLIGGFDRLDDEQRSQFLATGVMHLLCISGLHVGIVAGGFLMAMAWGWLPRRLGWLLVVAVALSFLAMTEGRAPVIRATTLLILVAAAELLWRRRTSANALAAAGLIVWLIAPSDLFRLGPQLSFLAVATFMVLGRRFTRRSPPDDPLDRLIEASRSWPEQLVRGAIRILLGLLLLGLVVNLVTQPLVAWQFHVISPMAVPLSLLLTPLVALAMLTGWIMLLTAGWLPLAAVVFGWLCNAVLGLMLNLVEWSAGLPGSHLWVPGPPAWWLLGLYGLLGVWVSGWVRDWPRSRWWALLAVWLGLGAASGLSAWGPSSRAAADEIAVTFLAVGHGGATVIELPDGRTLLYDCGRLGQGQRAARTTSRFLWSRGKTHLDAVILSHPDLDHYNGLPALMDWISVGVVYLPEQFNTAEGPAIEALFAALARHRVDVRLIEQGDRFTLPAGKLEVIWPPPELPPGSDNAASVVLGLEHHAARLLLTADLEAAGLDWLVAQPRRPIDVFQVPHHGSTASDPWVLSAWAQPRVAIVSRGAGPLAPETRGAYTRHGSHLLVTSEVGAITVRLTPQEVRIHTFRHGPIAQWGNR